MSKQAMKFAQKIEVPNFVTKALLYSIARKTFNDSCQCRCGIDGFVKDTGMSTRTVIRHLNKLKELNIITVARRSGTGFGRLNSDIEMVGFRDWLQVQQGKMPSAPAVTLPQNGQCAELASGQVSEQSHIYKDTKTRGKRQGSPLHVSKVPLVSDREVSEGSSVGNPVAATPYTTQDEVCCYAEDDDQAWEVVAEDPYDLYRDNIEFLGLKPDDEVLQ